jgi:hypothetical protein
MRDVMTDSEAMRFSRKPPVAFGRGLFAFCVLMTGVSLASGIGLPFALPVPLGVVFAVLGAAGVVAGGYGALEGLAMTRPWWAVEVRGSVYISRTSYFGRKNKRFDLAAVTRVRCWVVRGNEGGGYIARMSVRSPTAHGEIQPVALGSPDSSRELLALADALAQHPDPAVTGQATARLRMLASARRSELESLIKAQRASRRGS